MDFDMAGVKLSCGLIAVIAGHERQPGVYSGFAARRPAGHSLIKAQNVSTDAHKSVLTFLGFRR